MEEVILESLKKLMNDSELLKTWLDIHSQSATSEIPALAGRLKTIEQDITTNNRRLENLTARLADLPQEVQAAPIYKQMQTTQEKIRELEHTRASLALLS